MGEILLSLHNEKSIAISPYPDQLKEIKEVYEENIKLH
jgi:hypothetical protein